MRSGMNTKSVRPLAALALLGMAIVPSSSSAQNFVERATPLGINQRFMSGLDKIGSLPPMHDWVQQGVAVGDLDGDGLSDLVVAARLKGTHVFRNLSPAPFGDVTKLSNVQSQNYDNAPALGDYDNDGALDLFLGVHLPLEGPIQGTDRLYRNADNGRFLNTTALSAIQCLGHTVFAKWYDIDFDGDVDLYAAQFNGTSNVLMINHGDGSFSNRAEEYGVDVGGSTHVFAIADLDGDDLPEIVLGNDFVVSAKGGFASNTDDIILKAIGDGHYIDVSDGSGIELNGIHPDGSTTMGIALGDVNYDGELDIYRTEVGVQYLSINNGWPGSGLPFVNEQAAYNVVGDVAIGFSNSGTAVGWGCAFFDADLDLWLDLAKANGHVADVHPRLQQNFFYRGNGPLDNFSFTDETAAFGLADHFDDRGLATGDLDNDGDVDLIFTPPGSSLRYFENRVPREGRGFLKVYADTQTSAANGIGTEVLFTDRLGYPHLRVIGADGSTASQSEYMAHFGLGLEKSVDVSVKFPSGITRVIEDVAPNSTLHVLEPKLFSIKETSLPVLGAKKSVLTKLGSGSAQYDKLPAGSTGGTSGSLIRGGQKEALPAGPGSGPDPSGKFFQVNVFAFDQSGARLGDSADVQIVVPGLEPLGKVENVFDNHFRRTFIPSEEAGEYRVVATINGWTPAIRPTLNVVGPTFPTVCSVNLSVEAVRAGSADPITVSFAPKDFMGRAIGAGQEVLIAIPTAGIAATPMSDQGAGLYKFSLSAPAIEGTHPLVITVNGELVDTDASIDAGGTPDIVTTGYYEESPQYNIAQNPHHLRMKITPRDLAGVRTGGLGTLSFVFVPAPGGAEPVYENEELRAIQANGDISITIERDPASAIGSARGSFSAFIDGVLVANGPYQF